MESRDDKDYFENNRYITELTPENFDKVSPWKLLPEKMRKVCGMVLFYAPWCPHCKHAAPIWEEAAKTTGFCDWYAFNCEKYKGHVGTIKEDMPNLIRGYPTMVYYNNGSPTEIYEGEVSVSGLLGACSRNCKSKS